MDDFQTNEVVIELWPYSARALKPASESLDVVSVMTLFCWLAITVFFLGLKGSHAGVLWLLGGIGALTTNVFSRTRGISCLRITSGGITFDWRVGNHLARSHFLPWARADKIYVDFNKKDVSKSKLCFHDDRGTLFKIGFDQIATRTNWNQLTNEIRIRARTQPRGLDDSFEKMAILEKDASFTKLWLEALSEPPQRHRLEPLTSGQLLRSGQYTIVARLGAGGQGIAYLAKDTKGDKVVLKEYLLPVYVDAVARRCALEKFEHEARLLMGLDHPGLVKFLDCFVEDHRAYMVLEYIDGTNLKKKVELRGALSEAEVRSLAIKFCNILESLQDRTPPLVHQDFTPDNIIETASGAIKLIDFTVANQKTSDAVTSGVIGKQSYMSPEQFKGRVSPRTDIYALGATLCFLLTARDPEPLESLHPITERADLSPEFDAIIAKCTELDESKRYQWACDVRREIETLPPVS